MKEEIKKQGVIKLNKGKTNTEAWTRFRRLSLIAILVLGYFAWSQEVVAQNYPTRPITMLIDVQAGGGVDVGGRLLAQEAAKILGQEIIPVNKTGGGGSVGAKALVDSKADGYTILATPSDQLIYNPQMESVGYDLKDFTPIIQFGVLNNCFLVRGDSPFKSFKDLINFARANPGKVSFGPPQFGSSPHLAMEHVAMEEKVNIPMIPFQGSAPAITSLLGGHITACVGSTSTIMQHLKAGKVRVLAVTALKRIEAIPDAPTLVELGYPYGDAFTSIYLFAAPKGTPTEVVKKLEETFRRSMNTPSFTAYAKSGYLFVDDPLSGQALFEYLEAKYPKIGDILKKIKIK